MGIVACDLVLITIRMEFTLWDLEFVLCDVEFYLLYSMPVTIRLLLARASILSFMSYT